VTGATDSLPGKSFDDQHVQDIAELLESRVAGLHVTRLPNGDISLRIRGGDMSLRSDGDGNLVGQSEGEPLLVIDGMPVSDGQLSNTLRALNPHEIKNIQVLKDVSSTSFYGIRGAHGVILITMKNDQL
jgi:TonB-dependent SusC/RagA subfamily outer membrane receptor